MLGVDDLADNGVERCDRGRTLHVRNRARITLHGPEIGDAAPLRIIDNPLTVGASVDICRDESGMVAHDVVGRLH